MHKSILKARELFHETQQYSTSQLRILYCTYQKQLFCTTCDFHKIMVVILLLHIRGH